MTTPDDIVTRLREAVCWCNEDDGICHVCEAADEIERLRIRADKWEHAAVMAYHFPVHGIGFGPLNCTNCADALEARKQAEAANGNA